MSDHSHCTFNCGGTDCDAVASTYEILPECKHENGWYDEVRIWHFRKRVFICTDCMEIIKPPKEQ